MRKHDLVSSFMIFCFGLFVVLYSSYFNLGTLRRPGSGFIPFLSGVIICIFSVVTFLQAFFQRSAELEKIWARVNFRVLIFVILMLLVYPVLLNLLGFIASSFLLLTVIMRYAGGQTWMRTIFGAGLSSTASYLLFETWLKTQLPTGIIGF